MFGRVSLTKRSSLLAPLFLLLGACGSTETDGAARTGGAGGISSDAGNDASPAGGSGGASGSAGNAGDSGDAGTAGSAGSAGTGGAEPWLQPKCDSSAPPVGAAVKGDCNAEGWCFENPLPRALDVTSIWGFGADDVWLSAYEGLYHYAGGSWSRVGSTTGAIWGSAPDDVWLAHDQGIDHYDGGAWSTVSTIGPLRAIHGASATHAWAVGDDGLVAHLDASGWSVVPAFTTKDLRAVWVAGPDDLWLLAFDFLQGQLLHRVGTTVSSVTPVGWYSVRSVWSSSPTDVWFGGRLSGGWGRLARFDGNGITEVSLPQGTSSIESIWGFGADDVWFGTGSEMLRWDGGSIAPVPAPPFVGSASIWGASSADIWAGDDDASPILHYDGTAWKPLGLDATRFDAVWGSAWNDVWAVGSDGVSAHFDGSQWTVIPVPTSALLTAVTGVAGEAYTVDESGKLFLNTGTGWSMIADAGTQLTAARAVGPGRVLIAGDGYVALFDNGVLTPIPGYTGEIEGIWASASNDIWVAGDGGIGRWDGAQWNDVSLAHLTNFDGFSRVVGSSADDVYVINEFDVFHFDGATWSVVDATPSLPSSVWMCDATLWVAQSSGEIVRIQGGQVVHTHDAEAAIDAIWAASPTHLVAVGRRSEIVRLAK